MNAFTKSLLVALLVGTARANGQFEGIVESRNYTLDDRGAGQSFNMTIWVRRDMVKIRIPSMGEVPGSTVIYRHDRKISYVFNDEEKTYFEVSLANQEMAQQQRDQDPDKPKVERTKRKRKILGFPCVQLKLKRGESETEIWGTKSLGDLAARLDSLLGDSEARSQGADMELLRQLRLFPLVSVTRLGGKVVDSQEVTKIVRRQLSADLFTVPADYKKQRPMEPIDGH
jgi:hypothetical protein